MSIREASLDPNFGPFWSSQNVQKIHVGTDTLCRSRPSSFATWQNIASPTPPTPFCLSRSPQILSLWCHFLTRTTAPHGFPIPMPHAQNNLVSTSPIRTQRPRYAPNDPTRPLRLPWFQVKKSRRHSLQLPTLCANRKTVASTHFVIEELLQIRKSSPRGPHATRKYEETPLLFSSYF